MRRNKGEDCQWVVDCLHLRGQAAVRGAGILGRGVHRPQQPVQDPDRVEPQGLGPLRDLHNGVFIRFSPNMGQGKAELHGWLLSRIGGQGP